MVYSYRNTAAGIYRGRRCRHGPYDPDQAVN
jgi:hypothetical protein